MSSPDRTRRNRYPLWLAVLLLTGGNAMSLEQPQYTVLHRDGDIEYRQYETYLVSEAMIEDAESSREAGNEGFRRLFRYITGNNESRSKIAAAAPAEVIPAKSAGEKISMTTPVQQVNSPEGWRVTFMLPSRYTLETAPVPTDPGVRIREVPGKLMAVLRYSGRWTEQNYNRKKSALQAALDAGNVTAVGEVRTAFYNPPFTPPFLRRNEVMVEVSGLPEAAAGQAPSERASAY